MGQKDISLVRYFEDNDRYADLINGFIFDGDQIVSGDDIHELDSRETGLLTKFRKRIRFQKYRDAVRKVVFGLGFVVIGLENQDFIDFSMPVRIMLEDAAGYDKQLRQIRKRHRNRHDLHEDEFLSGFSADDKVHPVITICIYYGQKPYDGARELYQIMEYENLPNNLKRYLNNYKIHVLEIGKFLDIDRFQTDIREVFGFIQRSENPEEEKAFTFQNKDRFQELDEDAYDVITAVTGSKELELIKNNYRYKGGKINMCQAILGMIDEGRAEGETKLVGVIRKKYGQKKGISAISDDLGLDYAYVEEVTAFFDKKPEWTDFQIAEALVKR